ncbi:MAG: ATP-binding protein [Ignavibacteriaceae bacterium]
MKNQKEFSQNDLTLFSIISVQAGQLIKNLELQRETYQKRKEAEKLLELDKIKTNFFTNISHEFRTPLTLIQGPAKQILENAADTKIKEDADLIYRSAGKLNRLVDQLLDISSIEAGKMKLKTSCKKLFPVIKHIISSFKSFAERKKISLTLDIPREEITLYLDIDKIDKILSNILSNALKFTPEGGKVNVIISLPVNKSYLIEPEAIQIQKESDATPVIDSVEILVSDTGIGIPEEQLDKIFDRFYQIDNKLSKDYEGTGIGLSLTKELVNLHKGQISVESREGKGSIFRIKLPLGNEHLLPEEIVEETLVSDNKHEENDELVFQFPVSNQSSRQKEESLFVNIINNNSGNNGEEEIPSLLIIDDNSDVRKYITEILTGFYKIVEASNGEEGLCKSFEEIPDLIISDIMMPKIDGIELCRLLKSDARTSHIPVILLTAKATLNDKLEGLETGADDYIMKPFEAQELKARIKNLLVQRKRIHEYFQRHGLFEVEDNLVTNVDKKFLQKVLELINENIENPGFNVDYFADNLAISRSLLHKKLIALIGESPGELIKRVRLNKAAKLIENKSGNVTEIGH